jgi:hypothetical protein
MAEDEVQRRVQIEPARHVMSQRVQGPHHTSQSLAQSAAQPFSQWSSHGPSGGQVHGPDVSQPFSTFPSQSEKPAAHDCVTQRSP